MARTDAEKVKGILKTSLSDEEINPYIDTANVIVTQVLSGADLGADLLAEIEKWFTAHLIALTRQRQAQSVKIGDASETYAKLGVRLNATTYGQTVAMLDTSGLLGKQGMKKVMFEAISSFTEY